MARKRTAKSKPSIRKTKHFYLLIAIAALLIIAGALLLVNKKNSEMLASRGMFKVSAQNVAYDGTSGYLARPELSGTYPGVVMIHEWWGLNDNIKDMAKQLASEGYVVLAVDLYNGNVASTSGEAINFVSNLNQTRALENMKAALAYLRSQNAEKIASLGWCFGGGQSLQLALNEKLDATVIYYGSLVTNETRLSVIEWPVMGVFGDNDTSIPVSTVQEFSDSLDNLGVDNEIYLYEGVGHAFANPSGMNYAPEQTKDAWEKTVAFLDKHLK